MAKLRKQVSIDFLNHLKLSVNDMLQSKIPQSTKLKLCSIMERLLNETKSYNGYKYLYWKRYGKLEWEEAKSKGVYNEIPKEFITGPDYDGKMEFISDIQGEFSRMYV